MQRLFVLALAAGMVGACAPQQQSVEQVAAKQELIKAECNLYKGTGGTPPECKR